LPRSFPTRHFQSLVTTTVITSSDPIAGIAAATDTR
jgi:hypothetical protein